jgi:cytochrome c oxidase subunit 2
MDNARRNLCLGALAGVGTLLCGGAIHAKEGASANAKGRVIKMEAKKYVYTPNEIVLKKGQPVTLEFTSVDFVHGFKVPDLNIRADLVPGKVTKVQLKADKPGTYEFICDNFCGSGHEDMHGKIIVKA